MPVEPLVARQGAFCRAGVRRRQPAARRRICLPQAGIEPRSGRPWPVCRRRQSVKEPGDRRSGRNRSLWRLLVRHVAGLQWCAVDEGGPGPVCDGLHVRVLPGQGNARGPGHAGVVICMQPYKKENQNFCFAFNPLRSSRPPRSPRTPARFAPWRAASWT